MLNDLLNSIYVYYAAIVVIGIYMSNKIPSNLKTLYENNIFKIIILVIILSKNNNNLMNSVILAGAGVYGAQYIVNNIVNKEKFKIDVTDGGFKLSGVRQTSKSGESNVINITQSSSESS